MVSKQLFIKNRHLYDYFDLELEGGFQQSVTAKEARQIIEDNQGVRVTKASERQDATRPPAKMAIAGTVIQRHDPHYHRQQLCGPLRVMGQGYILHDLYLRRAH